MSNKIITYLNASQKVSQRVGRIVPLLLLFLMLILGSGNVWGQTGYSGTYYIRSESTNKNTDGDYYLCPTKNWYLYKATNSYEDDTDDNDDNGQPFLTTYQCKDGVYDASKAVWDVVKHPTETDCYYIIQRKTGRYMVSNGQIGTNANRMRVHLEAVADATALANLGDLALFEITLHSGHIDIVPHSTDGRNGDTYKYLVVNFKNFNELKGSKGKDGGPSNAVTAGIIGLYDQEENHKWFLESAKCTTPVITFSNTTSTITITAGDGESIYYTTDGSNPDANSNVYSEPFELTEGKVIKAISQKNNLIDSEITTLTVEKLATPTISFNEETREATITAAEGVEIYYTTNDTDPTIEESTEHGESPVVIASALPSTKIHAQAVKSGSINSDVATKTDIPVKVLTNPTIILAEEELVYDGSAKEPAITVKDGDVVVSNDEYVVTYSNNTNAGTASVTVSDKANGDYEVSGSMFFIITPKSIGDGDKAAEGIDIQIEQMGENVEVTSVKDGGTTLVVDEDYTVAIEKQGDDWIIIVSGIGNYEGSARGLFVLAKFYKAAGADKAVAAYRSPKDFSKPSGIDIYIVKKVNPSIGTVVVSSIDYLPKDVPVLMSRNAEVMGFLASEKPAEIPEITAETKNSNLLYESYKGLEVDAAQVYMLYLGEFVLTKAGTFNGGGNFYLYNPNYKIEPDPEPTPEPDEPSSGESRGVLQIIIEEWDDQDETTGIDDLKNEKTEEWKLTGWYSLDGRRLSGKPTKGGIYIHKGQKIYIKR